MSLTSPGVRVESILARIMRHPAVGALARSPLFWGVLALKLVVGTFVASTYLRDLFCPFVGYFVESGFANPWAWFAEIGSPRAFPYPPVMLYGLAAGRAALAFVASGDWQVANWGDLLAVRLPLLAADVAVCVVLCIWQPQRVRLVLLAYWCSPLAFYITYWHGQLDVFPTAIFLVGLLLLGRKHALISATVIGASLATKSHLWVGLPFVAAFLWRRDGVRSMAAFLSLAIGAAFALQLPWLLSDAYRMMVYGSEEQSRALAMSIPIGSSGLQLLVVPVVLSVLLLRFVAYRRHNWDLLLLYLGLAFCVFVLLAPPRPGYFLWSLPFIVGFYSRQVGRHMVGFHLYGIAGLLFFLSGPESDLFDALALVSPDLRGVSPYPALVRLMGGENGLALVRNLLFGLMFAGMSTMLVEMYLLGVRGNRAHRVRTRPFLIGMAGDSGAGKDTMCRLLEEVLGRSRCMTISGDDYHRWPRGHKMWNVHTHLNVSANDLRRQQGHSIAIARGEGVRKGTYDHSTGTFTPETWVDPSNYVIFAGLHTLALDAQRSLYELTIFVAPDDNLRRNWKVRRDHSERGYRPEDVLRKLDERERDRLKFILSQARHADIVVTFRPTAPIAPDDLDSKVDLVLEVTGSNGFSWAGVAEALAQVPTLMVDHDPFLSTMRQRLTIEGHVTAKDLSRFAASLLEDLDELCDMPAFHSGLDGCLQLVLLVALVDRLRLGEARAPSALGAA